MEVKRHEHWNTTKRKEARRTHTTILVHAILALQVCLCLEANANPLRIHQITVHNQRLRTDWKHWLFQQRALVSPGLHLCVLVRLASATHGGSMPMPIGKVYHGVFIALSLFQQRVLVFWGLHLSVSVIAKLNWHQSRISSSRIYLLKWERTGWHNNTTNIEVLLQEHYRAIWHCWNAAEHTMCKIYQVGFCERGNFWVSYC